MEIRPNTILLIALAALLVACGQPPAPAGQVSFVDVAQAAARQEDRVSVEQLAEWLIEERKDFVLIDVRSQDEYAKAKIRDAQNIPLAELVASETIATLPGDRKVVVYSNGSENAAKAVTMLRLAGLDAHLVTGGFNAWHERILNPDIPADELDGESPQVSAQRAYSCYFVGDRGEGTAERSGAPQPFEPPVFEQQQQEDPPPLPPVGEESC
ncbi:MAG TPA: rhodanese-like domain-containing protein [Woeseiaceae bacterium]|nr:rhodanese-like domain-containing protein [Woeseiaceae bacterium]